MTMTAQNATGPTILRCRGNVFTESMRSNNTEDIQNTRFPLIRHGPESKRRVLQSFYCCLYVRYREIVFTEPLLPTGKRRPVISFLLPLPLTSFLPSILSFFILFSVQFNYNIKYAHSSIYWKN